MRGFENGLNCPVGFLWDTLCDLIDFLLILEAVDVKKKNKQNKTKQNKGEEIGALTEEVWLEIAIKWNAHVRK